MDVKELAKLKEHKVELLNSKEHKDIRLVEDAFHKRTSGRYVGDFVFGANDGIITTFAIVAGAWGAGLPSTIVIILGFANLLADGVSMGMGNYLGSKSEREYGKKLREREGWEIDNIPQVEEKQVREVFKQWGFKGMELDNAMKVVTTNKKAWLEILLRHEFGIIEEEKSSSLKHGLVTFFAFAIAGFVPLIAFLISFSGNAFYLSIFLTGATMFTVGVLRSRLSSTSWIKSGFEVLAVGSVAAVVAYFVGDVIEKIVS